MIESWSSGPRAKARPRRSLCLAIGAAAAVSSLVATAVPAANIEWVLTEAECDPVEPTTEIPCGSYGTFYIGTSDAPQGCTERDGGSDDPQSYPPPMTMGKPMQIELPPVFPLDGGRRSDRGPGDDWWLSVIDFTGSHGKNTWWLAEQIAGHGRAKLSYVDHPTLVQLLGPDIGDFHLLASLCRVVDQVDTLGRPAPLAVNLSLGRGIAAGETVEEGGCDRDQLLCQIEMVVQGLRERGSRVVAAAGNHGEPLLPAALPSVAAVGALDLTQMLGSKATESSWETPPEHEALFPANGLCLRGGVAAPGGSSFASAIFAAWLSVARDRLPELDPLNGLLWAPQWSDAQGCFVLSAGPMEVSRCNAGFDEIAKSLSVPGANACWAVEGETSTLWAGPIPPPEPQPAWPSFDQWIKFNHPTPESDPCVPCTGGPNFAFQAGGSRQGGEDVSINLSRAVPLPGHHLHQVYLRVGDAFYPLGLGTSASTIGEADVEYLTLPGWGAVVDYTRAASLVWILSESAVEDCSPGGSGDCYWSATQVLWNLH